MACERTLSEMEEYEAMSDVEFEDAGAGTTPRVASSNSSAGNHTDTPPVSTALPTPAPWSAPKPVEHHAAASSSPSTPGSQNPCPVEVHKHHLATASSSGSATGTPVPCPIAGCQESFPSMLETQTHAEKVHDRYLCVFQECRKSRIPYLAQSSLRRHMVDFHQLGDRLARPTRFGAEDDQDRQAHQPKQLQILLPKQPNHDDQHRQEQPQPRVPGDDSSLACTNCTATLPDKAALQAHLRDVHNLYLCTVPGCERKDRPFRKDNYERHMLGIHHIDVKMSAQPPAHQHHPVVTGHGGAASVPPHPCPIQNCTATCPDLSGLETHLKDEHRMYLCTVSGCPKNNQPFSWWDQYDRHMVTAHQTDVTRANWRQKDKEARQGIARLLGVEYDDNMRRQLDGREGGQALYDVEAAVPGKRKREDDEGLSGGRLGGIESFLDAVKRMREGHESGLTCRPAATPPARGGIESFLQETTRISQQHEAGVAVRSATTPAFMPSPAPAAIPSRVLPPRPAGTQAQMQVAIRPAMPTGTTPTRPAAVPLGIPALSSAAMHQAITSYTSPYPMVPNPNPYPLVPHPSSSPAHTSAPPTPPLHPGPVEPGHTLTEINNPLPHLQRENARLTTLVTNLSAQLIHERARQEATLVAANEKRFREKDGMVRRHQEELEAVVAMASNGGRIKRQHEYMDELRRDWRDMYDEEVREERRRHKFAEREIWGLLRGVGGGRGG
ncbi:hypothetical protein GE09DRAFT_1294938 [Coniochaeta sp. 2T2.1]|nr:hypothetical protein GE09DRAFT_1294938 [Coniochaeta sp. 2T2.1]